MSTASNFASASYTQTITQTISKTTSYIGQGFETPGCRGGQEGDFAGDLFTMMQVPLVPVYATSTQLTNITTEVGAGCSATDSQSASTDSLMQLLQGLESEIAQLNGELQSGSSSASTSTSSASQGAASCSSGASSYGLQGDYAQLYSEAVGEAQDGSSFSVKLPSGETLSGKSSWTEIEVAGDNSLFTPGDPSAPDAGRQAFDNQIGQFLELAQSDSGSSSAAGEIANYATTTTFSGNNSAMSWTGQFSLAPANAIPKSS